MKFLTGLLRLLKFKRGADESGEGDERNKLDENSPKIEKDEQKEESGQEGKPAVKPGRLKVITAAATLVMLTALGFAAWKNFFPAETEPRNTASVWVPISAADHALFQAVRGGDAQEVRRCLSEGGNPYAPNEWGVTPIKAAIAVGRADMVREFLASGRSGSPDELKSLLVYAVVQNRPEAVRELVKLPLGINAPDKNGYTPLLYAIDRNHLNVANELLNGGADANARGGDGTHPLIAAVTRGKHDVVAALLKAGADWRAVSTSGETAIGIARQRHRDAIVALLMEAETPPKDIQDMYDEYMKLPPESGGNLQTLRAKEIS